MLHIHPAIPTGTREDTFGCIASSARPCRTESLSPRHAARSTPHATRTPGRPRRSLRPPLRPSPKPRARTSPPSFSTGTCRLVARSLASPDFVHAMAACRSLSPRHLARVPRLSSAPPARARDARPAPRQRPCHSFCPVALPAGASHRVLQQVRPQEAERARGER